MSPASAKIWSSGTAIALSNTKKEWEHFSEHKMLTGVPEWSFDTFVLEIDSTSLGKITCLRQKMLTEKIYIKPTVGQMSCWQKLMSSYTAIG